MANRKENDELLAQVLESHDTMGQELNFINTVFSFLARKTKYLQQNDASSQIQKIVTKHVEKAKQNKDKRGKKKNKKTKSDNKGKNGARSNENKDASKAGSESISVATDNDRKKNDNNSENKSNINNNDGTSKAKNKNNNEDKEDSDNDDEDGEKLIGNGGETDKYIWTQTLEDVEMKIDVPKDTIGKDCLVTFEERHLKVKLRGSDCYIINGELHDDIDSEDCTWTLDEEYGKEGKTLTLFLNKHKGMNWWPRVIVGDAQIDTKKIVPANSKLDDLEPDVRQTVEKMMFDQRQKMQGKPTSKELEQQQILEKFKSQHPEMDFSNVKFG